ncbi:hypothetical protein K493DRAFT_273933 [Basidiobolus meristosporus CBS 931.73]|uniref:Ubiquitin-like domain-containing protein n=1 Tax=Basidiobolus meristosporus CBS 931.73 TaxID=1314790 RepID=A0A1Y1Z977_9FUNG|nr:hypothetical protein K493DRAFT_273933 [Basidiobolus meristosporus CBS 931.73]|eukprot:ORY06830.1 hypothetical protein K493DRAFT_273933 [Basidiobolus meristosporus CBS 931.73]
MTEQEPSTTNHDSVRITFLLLSGKRHSLTFQPSNTIGEVKQYLFDNWPSEWTEGQPTSPASLKIVHLGRFLENSSTIASTKINTQQENIVHLTIKIPSQTDSNDTNKHSDNAPKCRVCLIL